MRHAFLGLALSLFAAVLAAESIPPAAIVVPEAGQPVPPLRSALERPAVVAALDRLEDHEVAAVRRRNASGARPMQAGVTRELAAVAVAAPDVATFERPWRWRGAVQVDAASELRLKLDAVSFPAGANFWVYSTGNGAAMWFDATLAYDGTIWTPSAFGDTIVLEVESSQPFPFRISAVAEIFSAERLLPAGDSAPCLRDATCETNGAVADIGRAIAHMQYISGGQPYICTGGLLIDRARTFTPYFLTANHCISSAAQASTLQTFWDYRATTCNAAAPPLALLPRVAGATLLAASAGSDVALLRLPSTPSGARFFLGWSSAAVAAGTYLYRVSHPSGLPQGYSVSQAETLSRECLDGPRTRYIYSTPLYGGVVGGSSGAPVISQQGYVVGQLLGACPGGVDPCGPAVRTMDGALSASWPIVKPYLDAQTTDCTACTPNSTTACMLGNRFKVTIDWRDPYINATGVGHPIRYAENTPQVHPEHGPIIESAFFAFYDVFPNSVETMVKMTKGVGINNKFWIFVTGFAGAEYTVNVQDTRTCAVWQRTMPRDSVTAIREYEAFPLP